MFPAGLQECDAVPTGSLTACGTVPGNLGVRLRCASPNGGHADGIEPCAMLGQTCTKEVGSNSAASCSGSRGFNCSTTTCSGKSAVDCNPAGTGTFDRGINCASYGGGDCVAVDEAGATACVPVAGALPCPADAVPKCTINSVTGLPKGIVASCVGGHEVTVDCTKLGLPCDDSVPVPTYDPAAACIRRSPPAAPTEVCTAEDSCLANSVQSCGRGLLQTVDCASVGLKDCKVTKGKAACSPP